MSYSTDLVAKSCNEPIRGKKMIKGAGGGFGFEIADLSRLDRFLILGHEGGTYYADQRTLTVQTVDCIDRLLAANRGREVVERIVEISESGRAPKNDPAVFALAYVAAKPGHEASYLALNNLRKVCRTGTHLFDFLNHCKSLNRGWGNAFKNAVADWYDRSPLSLANQVTKYAQRNGWSHRDVLRKCHATTQDTALNNVLRYVTQRETWKRETATGEAFGFLCAVEECQNPTTTDTRRIQLIEQYGLVREHLPTQSLNNPAIWEALLQKMPLTALLRNLGKLASIGLTKPLSAASKHACDLIGDVEALKAQRVHPVAVLLASKVYAAGHGVLGSLTWTPDQQILRALDGAFYSAFANVEPTGKRFLLGVDVSGSMSGGGCVGSPFITPREAAGVMAMVVARTEKNSFVHGFSNTFVPLNISPNDSLPTVLRTMSGLPFATTRCALPMEYARKAGINVDVFCIFTDNETNCGPHPSTALNDYRKSSGIKSKLAVFGFTNSNFSIADPSDNGMLDFVGFDAHTPLLLADFAR